MDKVLSAVSFDLTGTLIETKEPVGEVYSRYARAHGLCVTAAQAKLGFFRALATAPPLAFGPLPEPARLERERQWWKDVVARALAPGSAAVAERIFEDLFAHYSAAPAWRLLPGAKSVLSELRALGIRTIVVSNFDSRAVGLLAALGLAPLLDKVTISSLAGVAKPDPEIFRLPLRPWGIEPRRAAHVGDSLLNDIVAAQAAGLTAIYLRRANAAGERSEWLEIRSLFDLTSALEKSGFTFPATLG